MPASPHSTSSSTRLAVKKGVIARKPRGEHDLREVARALIKDGQAAKGGHGDLAAKLRLPYRRAIGAQRFTRPPLADPIRTSKTGNSGERPEHAFPAETGRYRH
jgi:hypothetical protein